LNIVVLNSLLPFYSLREGREIVRRYSRAGLDKGKIGKRQGGRGGGCNEVRVVCFSIG